MSVGSITIVAMFDTTGRAVEVVDLAGLPIHELGGRVEQNAVNRRREEAEGLVLAAAWADAHDRLTEGPFSPQVERSCFYGGKGTPMVAEFCAGEFASLQRLPYHQGRAMIADALDLRHRLPLLWRQTVAGEVMAWKAQKVAQATRELATEAAAEVDAAICGLVESLSWSRFQKILAAAVLEADPELAAERAERARTAREVWLSQCEDGLKTLIARLDAGDGLLFLAAVSRIADILRAEGDTDPVGPRRAKAVGLLARPAEAAALLAAHRDDPDTDQPGEPADPEPAPDVDLNLGDQNPSDDIVDDCPDDHEPDAPAPGDEAAEDAVADVAREHHLSDESAEPPVEPPIDDETAPVPDPQAVAEQAHTSLGVDSPFGDLTAKGLRAVRPRVVLSFHLSDAAVRDGHGVVRLEGGDPMTLDQLRDWLAQTGCVVQVRPVSIPADTEPVDGYEIPARVRAAERLREIADTFPWGSCTTATMDLDHSERYVAPDDGGPPGQTGVDKLGPLTRSPHRAATHGKWRKHQPSPGLYVWRSPHGWIYLVTNHGTLALGRTAYAHAVWQAAVREPVPAA